MLPGSSCRTVEFLPQNGLLVGCERAADLRQHLRRRDRACPPVGIGHQVCQALRSEEHTSELQSLRDLVCRLLLEKKKKYQITSADTKENLIDVLRNINTITS